MPAPASRQILGSCHCGNIRFTLTWPAEAAEIPGRACGCTFCRKHRATWTSHPDASVSVTLQDPTRINKYNFGTRTADFYVCSDCGVAPIAVCKIEKRRYAVVNVTTFEDMADLAFSAASTDFDGESTDDRLRRRQRNWISQVSFEGPTS